MQKIKRFALSFLFSVLILFQGVIPSFAKENQEAANREAEAAWELQNNELILEAFSNVSSDQIPSPYWNYTVLCNTGLIISPSGMASCTVDIFGDIDTVSKISSYMYLQKKNGNSYQTVANGTWNQLVYSYLSFLNYDKQLYSRGTYRVFVVHYVYGKDGGREEIQLTSHEMTY